MKTKTTTIILFCLLLTSNIFGQNNNKKIMQKNDSLKAVKIEIEKIQKKTRNNLSTLWTVVTLNMITADVLSLYIPESMEEWTDYADGKESEYMLGGAIMYQIPISMIYLSKKLPYKANRWANIIAAGAMTYAVIAGSESEPHYWVCAGAEIVGFSMIAWKAWKWKNPEDMQPQKHDLGMKLDYRKKTYGLTYTYNF